MRKSVMTVEHTDAEDRISSGLTFFKNKGSKRPGDILTGDKKSLHPDDSSPFKERSPGFKKVFNHRAVEKCRKKLFK